MRVMYKFGNGRSYRPSARRRRYMKIKRGLTLLAVFFLAVIVVIVYGRLTA